MKKGLVNKLVTYKYCGICSCPRYVHGRKEGVEQLAQDFLCHLIRQQIQNSFETGGLSKVADAAKQFKHSTA